MIIVDIETTGVEPSKNSILSIGAIDFDNPERQFYEECRIWEGAHVEPEALAYNGFTEAEIRDSTKKTDQEAVSSFLEWVKLSENHTIVGQNVSLDYEFLKQTAARYHLDWTLAKRMIDLHSVCYLHMVKRGMTPPLKNHRSDLDSDKICQYVGIPAEQKPHRSPLGGAKWEAEALSRLFYDRFLLSEFQKFPIPWLAA